MALSMPMSYYNLPRRRPTHRRRNATSIMAGDFDPRPERDVLTSRLSNIPPYLEVEKKTEEDRLKRKLEKRLKEREKKRKSREELKAAAAKRLAQGVGEVTTHASTSAVLVGSSSKGEEPTASSSTKCATRPTIHIPAMQRSVSITPPSSPRLSYADSTPGSTPGPSMSSSTSRTSSKRPRTPDDDEDVFTLDHFESLTPQQRPRKKRMAVKKGWKGWVEGSPEPSGKLINLDAVPILRERRTRSGKNFDAIGVGKDGWI